MALMFLGQVPHPETGAPVRDLETARMFIDQLEMLEVKTKGNLDKREEQLLNQSLTQLRMAFVDAVEAQPGAPASPPPVRPQPAPAAGHNAAPAAHEPADAPATEEEHRKKFTKKY
jgi:hypothetical protein